MKLMPIGTPATSDPMLRLISKWGEFCDRRFGTVGWQSRLRTDGDIALPPLGGVRIRPVEG
jgi:hypothetical protein